MHAECVRRTGARRPLVVGDRLDTDIEGARRAGAASLLVLTGVTDPAALLSAGPSTAPTCSPRTPRACWSPHPAVDRDGVGVGDAASWRSAPADGRRPAAARRRRGGRRTTASTGCGRCAWRTGPGTRTAAARAGSAPDDDAGRGGRWTGWGLGRPTAGRLRAACAAAACRADPASSFTRPVAHAWPK